MLNQEIKESLKIAFEKRNQTKDNISNAEIYRTIATKYNVHPERVRKHHRILVAQLKTNVETIYGHESIKKVNNTNGTLESSIEADFEPKNDLELAQLHKIDLSKYAISSYWSKLQTNGNFTSSISCKLKTIDDVDSEDILTLLSKYKSNYKPLLIKDILRNSKFTKPACAFIDITDFHLDKRDVKETPIEVKIKEYYDLLDGLLAKTYNSANIEEIAFVLGSDMLHTDNFFNQTTKFTQQEVTVRWDEAFNIAFDIYVNSINKLKQFCKNLKIILVAGNHSRTKEYYLSFALSKYFEKDKNIQFDISNAPRKVYSYGSTFIGLHHGNTKIENLPIVFAKEFTTEWGKAKYHEIKVGDKHHYMEKDYHGVRIKQLPACSNADTWHNDNNFVTSVQSAICSVYDKEKGRCIDIEERI